MRKEEADFQEKMNIPGLNTEDKKQISDQLAEQWVNRLDPNDDKLWVDEPHWLKHLLVLEMTKRTIGSSQ